MAAAKQYLGRVDGVRLAYHLSPGTAPTVVYFCGKTTPMDDPKAVSLEARCRGRGQAFLRFDYQGRSGSSGNYLEGTISRHIADARSLIDALIEGTVLFVGYSMGGAVMLHTGLAMPRRVVGLIGVAPAGDIGAHFDESTTAEQKATLERDGILWRTSPEYGDEPWAITLAEVEDARRHRLMDGPIALDCPLRLLHGTADPDVPWSVSLELAGRLTTDDAELVLLKDVGHLLREPKTIARLDRLLGDLLDQLA